MKPIADYLYRILKSPSRRSLSLIIIFFITSASPKLIFGQEPFFMEESPAPLDQSDLQDIDADPQGRMAAVGRQRELAVGGSPFYPLVMIKDTPQDPWTILNPPNFGSTWYELISVNFIPGTDGDFVVVGEYYPDPLLGYANGFLLRYYKNTDEWAIHSIQVPGALFHFIRDAVFDPDNPNRLLIVGTHGSVDPGGFCFVFTTMVIDFRIDTYTYTVLPTTQKGGLWSIAPLHNGNFIAAGIAAGECDYLPYPVVLEVEAGVEIIHPNPPPNTNGYWYSISALTALDDGDIFMVGGESFFGGSEFGTLAYWYNPVTQDYISFKPLDPDSTQNFLNQLWDVTVCPNGMIYAVGRIHYMYNNLHYRRGMIQSFDGESWKLHPVPETFNGGHYSELYGMTCLPNNQVYAVGLFRPAGSYDPRTLVMYNEIISDLSDEEISFSPSQFSLNQNYPNPFNPNTVISFQLPESDYVSLKVYDMLGNEVATLVNEEKPAGNYEVTFSAKGGSASGGDVYSLPSGIYFYKLTAGEYSESKKMILLK